MRRRRRTTCSFEANSGIWLQKNEQQIDQNTRTRTADVETHHILPALQDKLTVLQEKPIPRTYDTAQRLGLLVHLVEGSTATARTGNS